MGASGASSAAQALWASVHGRGVNTDSSAPMVIGPNSTTAGDREVRAVWIPCE